MPLREHYPLIDDRRHADIVAEARARIPRYTPEWTDVNESDPGFTLVELFAWLTEMQIYRLSKVPQLNYLKFLELVGIEMAPARPATAEVTFPVEADYGEPYTIVSARTQISTEAPDETGPIVFETDWALTALTAKLNAVQVFDGSAYHDRTQANQDPALPFEPFGSDAGTDSALMIGFQSDQEPPRVAFNLRFWVPESRRSVEPMRCIANDIRMFVSAELAWEYWNGAQWRPLDLLKDETGALTQSGHIHFRMPAKGEMPPSALGLISEPHYWLRARVIRAGYQQAPRLLAIRTNTVTVTQAETIEAEILGGSNGRPDQTVSLSSTPVIEGTLTLQVDEGEGFRTWTGVEDFFGSGPDHRHYVLNRTTGEIRFGNGRRGRRCRGNAGPHRARNRSLRGSDGEQVTVAAHPSRLVRDHRQRRDWGDGSAVVREHCVTTCADSSIRMMERRESASARDRGGGYVEPCHVEGRHSGRQCLRNLLGEVHVAGIARRKAILRHGPGRGCSRRQHHEHDEPALGLLFPARTGKRTRPAGCHRT